jgi:hypothetical protein
MQYLLVNGGVQMSAYDDFGRPDGWPVARGNRTQERPHTLVCGKCGGNGPRKGRTCKACLDIERARVELEESCADSAEALVS